MAYNGSMRRILLWITLSLVVVLAATTTWLWTADLGVFKPHIEEWVTDNVGREFAIDGDFSVDLARHTTVIANDIRLANPEWAGTQQMVRIGRAEIRVDTRSLWKRPVVIELVDIDDAEVILAGREEGAPNWALGDNKSMQVSKDEKAPILPVLFQQIDVNRLHLVHTGPHRTQPLDIKVQSFNEVHRADDILEFSVNAKVNDRPVIITAEAGGWTALLAGEDIRYQLEARLDTFELKSDGRIDDLNNIRRPDFRFEATGPDINDLVRLLGLEEKGEGEGDINISGSLTAIDNEPLLLDVEGNFGLLQVKASGSLSDLEKFEEVDIDVQADSPNLGGLLGLFDIDQVGEAPFHLDVKASRKRSVLVVEKAKMLFGDATFNLAATMPSFPAFDNSNVSLNIQGTDLERFRDLTQLPGRATGKFTVNANVDTLPDGGNEVQVDIETSFGVLEARGILTNADGNIGSQLELKASGDDLALLGSAYGLPNLPDSPFEISGSAVLEESALRTTQPVVASVNGITITLDGRATLNPELRGSDFDFSLAGPDLAALVGAFGPKEHVPNESYNVTGKLRVHENGLGIHDLTATVGTSNVRIDGLLVPGSGLHGSTFTVETSGPALEEIIDGVGTYEVTAGRYDLSGKIGLLEDAYRFDDIRFERDQGELSLDLEIGRPASRKWMKFDLRAQGHDMQELFGSAGRLEINEMPYSIVARGVRDDQHWSIENAQIDAEAVGLRANGTLDLGGDKSRTRFRFSGTIPDLSRVGTFGGQPMRPQSVSWDAEMNGSDGELRVDNLKARFGENEINGTLSIKTGDVPELTVELQSDSLVFAPLPEKPASIPEAEPTDRPARLIPDVPVPFEEMAKLNAAVSLNIGELQRNDLYLRDVRLNAELRDGRLDLGELGFGSRSGHLRARAVIDPADGDGEFSLDIVADELNFGAMGWNLDPAMTWNADISVSAIGNDLRSLLGNLSGVVFADIRGGRSNNKRLSSMLFGDFLNEIFGTVNPDRESQAFTQFDCIVMPAQIDDGVATHAPNAFVQTDKLLVVANSRIDLETESLDAAIRTTPRHGVSISAGELINPFLRITGTLAKPRITFDKQGVLVTGGAAVATGGLSIVAKSMWDRVKRAENACDVTAEAGREALHDRFPTELSQQQ